MAHAESGVPSRYLGVGWDLDADGVQNFVDVLFLFSCFVLFLFLFFHSDVFKHNFCFVLPSTSL